MSTTTRSEHVPRSLRDRVQEVMEPYAPGPDATLLSLVVDLVVFSCIVASCVLVVVELTTPGMEGACRIADRIFTAVFIVEYACRWYGARNRLSFPFSPLAVLDLLAILPGLLALGADLRLLRVFRGARLLRLARLLRVARLLRLFSYGPVLYQAVLRARIWWSAVTYQYRLANIGRLFVWALAILALGANVLHLTERTMDSVAGPFDAYWRSYWNILIVLVSGIEDKEPLSLLGRLEVTVLLIAGIVIVGMLTGEIVSMLLRRAQRAGMVPLKPPRASFERHIVILGANHHLGHIVEQVDAALGGRHHILVVAPEADKIPVADPESWRRVFAMVGEPRDPRVLDEAGVDHAARVIVLAPDPNGGSVRDADNRALMAAVAVLCRRRDTPLVVELNHSDSLRFTRGLPEVDFVLGRGFGDHLLSQAVLNPGVTACYDQLLTFTEDSNELYRVPVPEALVGRSFLEARLHFMDDDDETITLIGIDRSPRRAPGDGLVLCPEACLTEEELVLADDDVLVVMAYVRPSFARVHEAGEWQRTHLVEVRE